MTGKHRPEGEPSPGRLHALLDHRRADIIVSICCLLVVIPFGFIAVGVVAVMILLAWFV